jgi:hypothetical protein
MWYDNNSKKGLAERALLAAARYEKKYGCSPNVCFVNPGMLEANGNEEVVKANGLEIRPGRAILKDYFWVGVAED